MHILPLTSYYIHYCYVLCTNQRSFKSPSNSFFLSWHRFAPVHLPHILLTLPSTRLHVKAHCLPAPSQATAWQAVKPGLTGGQGSPQRALPVCTHFLLSAPLPEPHCLNLSPLHPPSCWGNIMPEVSLFIDMLFKRRPFPPLLVLCWKWSLNNGNSGRKSLCFYMCKKLPEIASPVSLKETFIKNISHELIHTESHFLHPWRVKYRSLKLYIYK